MKVHHRNHRVVGIRIRLGVSLLDGPNTTEGHLRVQIMDVLRAPSPMLFDPISLLVDEATAEVVGEEPQELLYDFLDCLMLQQQQPPPLGEPTDYCPGLCLDCDSRACLHASGRIKGPLRIVSGYLHRCASFSAQACLLSPSPCERVEAGSKRPAASLVPPEQRVPPSWPAKRAWPRRPSSPRFCLPPATARRPL